jgi:hypothetical protein
MSIGAANLFTRGIYREFIRAAASPRQETRVSRIASLLVKLGALEVVLLFTPQFAIDLQLTGGVLILQILPAAAISCRSSRRLPSVCTQTGSISGPSSLAPSQGWPAASSCSTRFRASGLAA